MSSDATQKGKSASTGWSVSVVAFAIGHLNMENPHILVPFLEHRTLMAISSNGHGLASVSAMVIAGADQWQMAKEC
jgi:hypothetical protein